MKCGICGKQADETGSLIEHLKSEHELLELASYAAMTMEHDQIRDKSAREHFLQFEQIRGELAGGGKSREVTIFVNNSSVRFVTHKVTGRDMKTKAEIQGDLELYKFDRGQLTLVFDGDLITIHESDRFVALPAQGRGAEGAA